MGCAARRAHELLQFLVGAGTIRSQFAIQSPFVDVVLESCPNVELCASTECFLVILSNEDILENPAGVRKA
jgi:hypothetical protein